MENAPNGHSSSRAPPRQHPRNPPIPLFANNNRRRNKISQQTHPSHHLSPRPSRGTNLDLPPRPLCPRHATPPIPKQGQQARLAPLGSGSRTRNLRPPTRQKRLKGTPRGWIPRHDKSRTGRMGETRMGRGVVGSSRRVL